MAIGALVNLSWIESTEVKEVGTIKKGWYRLKAKAVKEPTTNEKGTIVIPFQFAILTEDGGFAKETVFHRFCGPGEGSDHEAGTIRMWRNDLSAFLKAVFPKGIKDLEKVDLDVVEGMELYAYLQAGKEYQGQKRPEVVPSRWATSLPEGATEGPATA